MAKGASISGFPEWLPSERVVEQRVIDTLRKVFELNGFIGIETRAVETGASLLKKGETSKEIYLLSRLQEVGHESDTPIEERLGLHFDLTVPLSRYVVEHSGALAFPFKRWQIQKVWRGERPQEGRFREFVQADIDVIGAGDLPDHYEVELPLVMVSALEELRAYGLPKATVHANNRKLSEGFYRGLGLTDVEGVLREIDKLDKIGADEVARPRPAAPPKHRRAPASNWPSSPPPTVPSLPPSSMRCARLTASSRIPRPTRWLVRDSIPWP